MSLSVIPLAITMMAGPQIMSAIIFVTTSKPVKLSAYVLAPVAIAVTVGVAIFFALGNNFSLGDPSDNGSTGHIIQYVLVGLLVLMSIKNYVRRETIEPPKWLGTLEEAQTEGLDPRCFKSECVKSLAEISTPPSSGLDDLADNYLNNQSRWRWRSRRRCDPHPRLADRRRPRRASRRCG